MKEIDFSKQKQILKALADSIDMFYLAGGTALSLIYFQHRESYDLDFFTKEFHKEVIDQIITDLAQKTGLKIDLHAQQLKKGFAGMLVYIIHFPDGSYCKLDFVEDVIDLVAPLKRVDGINVLALDDIYLRKIFAIAGHVKSVDVIGRDIMTGGRQEAKDYYDLYCLSSISSPLSDFVMKLGEPALAEGLIRWFHTYDRMTMKTGMLELVTNKPIDYRMVEEHFKKEIEKLISLQIGEEK